MLKSVIIRLTAMCGFGLVAACSPQPSAEASPATQTSAAAQHPESGLKVIPLTVSTQNGKTHRFRVEVAASPAEQSQGLMFRTKLGPDEGMIFPSSPPQTRSFWMKNTVIPLDIIFIGPDRRIINIGHGVPYSLDPVLSEGPTVNVLELADGRAAELGIEPGDRVNW